MSEAKLQAAKELIQSKNYDTARLILKTMPNDPTAKKWLTKLDEIDLPLKLLKASQLIDLYQRGTNFEAVLRELQSRVRYEAFFQNLDESLELLNQITVLLSHSMDDALGQVFGSIPVGTPYLTHHIVEHLKSEMPKHHLIGFLRNYVRSQNAVKESYLLHLDAHLAFVYAPQKDPFQEQSSHGIDIDERLNYIRTLRQERPDIIFNNPNCILKVVILKNDKVIFCVDIIQEKNKFGIACPAFQIYEGVQIAYIALGEAGEIVSLLEEFAYFSELGEAEASMPEEDADSIENLRSIFGIDDNEAFENWLDDL